MQERTRILVEIALTVALCAVLNYVRIWQMPQGGSISLDMLPIIVLALRRGTRVGVIAGVVFGCIDASLDPSVVHPIQFLLDYPVAFGAVGLAGIFAPAWDSAVRAGDIRRGIVTAVIPGTLLAAAARYAAHVVSGVVFFGQFAPEGQPVLLYSALYNSFVFVSAIVCCAAASVVLPALARVAPVNAAPSGR